VLSGSNTYSGATIVRAGQLAVANADALSLSTLSNLVAGAVVFSNVTSAHFGGLAGSVDLGLTNTAGAAVGLAVGYNGFNTTYGGSLRGAGSLTKAGGGTLLLSANNSYSGGTVVNSGTLIASALASGIGNGSGSSIGSGSVTLNGGTLRFGNGSLLRVTNTVIGSVTFNGGTLAANEFVNLGHVNSVANTSTLTSDLLNLVGGYLDATGGTLVVLGNVANSGVLTNGDGSGNGVLQVGSTGNNWVTNSGTIALVAGTLDAGAITNTGTLVGYGILGATVHNSGLVSATNGALRLQNAATGAGTYRAESAATLTFNGGGLISSLFNTGGTIRVGGGVLTNNAIFNNAGTLALQGGTYQTSTRLTNATSAWITGFGTLSSAATLVNRGTILAQGGSALVIDSGLYNTGQVLAVSGSLQVTGVFTNQGTLNFISSAGLFNRAVVNQSTWSLTNGSSSLFDDNVLVTSNGTFQAQYFGHFRFGGNFRNQSTNSAAWNTLDTAPGAAPGNGDLFLFSGSGLTQTQVFAHPGLLLTGGFTPGPVTLSNAVQDVTSFAAVTGFDNNFAVGQLWLTNTTLELTQTVPGGPSGALFVNDLFLLDNAHLVISNDLRLYFVNSNSWDLANITLLGNAEIHQLHSTGFISLVVPEPNVLVLWLSGALTLLAARRRSRRSRSLIRQ